MVLFACFASFLGVVLLLLLLLLVMCFRCNAIVVFAVWVAGCPSAERAILEQSFENSARATEWAQLVGARGAWLVTEPSVQTASKSATVCRVETG